MNALEKELLFLVETHLQCIYDDKAFPDVDNTALAKKLITLFDLDEKCLKPAVHESLWDEKDVLSITYGDSIIKDGEPPLKTLKHFFDDHLKDTLSGIHILPFFPYSSDDGFSVIDYTQVNDGLGDWSYIEDIAKKYDLMADLVVNHCSSRSRWFDNFKQRKEPGKSYFFEAPADTDTSMVVRPRTSPLLREVETLDGKKHVWCTFSHDQVDLNFANPDVLCEMVNIIRLYLDRGVKIFRMDAVAFIWKELNHSSIHHPKTHEIIRLMRTLIEHHSPDAIIITETNVPNVENLSYFGNANEAHAVYNFSLPPLLIHALITGDCTHLKHWQMSMPPAQEGTFYFNFIASHDGIGLRPAEGFLNEEEINTVINSVQQTGARVSWRTDDSGNKKAYEINVTLFDALAGTVSGPDKWQNERFICAHGVMLALEGIPAFYIHSLLATQNYQEGVELTGSNRTINRYKWDRDEIENKLAQPHTHHAKIFTELKRLIEIRREQSAFHPNATSFTLHLGNQLFGFWRQSIKRTQSIFCIFNFSDEEVTIPLSSINLVDVTKWVDLVSGDAFTDMHQDLTFKPYQFIWLSNKWQ